MFWLAPHPSITLITGAYPGFGDGGVQFVRLKVADVAKQSHMSEVSNLWPGSRARLSFWVFNAQISILPTF